MGCFLEFLGILDSSRYVLTMSQPSKQHVPHKSRHRHVLRSQTSVISLKSQIVKLSTSPDSNFTYESPAPPLPLMQEALPS